MHARFARVGFLTLLFPIEVYSNCTPPVNTKSLRSWVAFSNHWWKKQILKISSGECKMVNTTLLVALLTLAIEALGLFFIKGKERFWLVFLMVVTIIVFATVYVLQRTIG